MSTVTLPSDQTRTTVSQATTIEQAGRVAEVAAAVRVAQDFPRDISAAIERMRLACSQRSLADRAFYSMPRAGGRVEGSTVHLMRELAGCYGNIDYGIRELDRDDEAGRSEMQAWAWDQERNVRNSRSFVVPHARMANKRRQPLIDLADITNNNNNVAARAVRECIRAVMPVWFVAEAEEIAARTLNAGDSGKTFAQQVADMTAWFRDTHGVTVEQLEARLDRAKSDWTPQDVAVLRVVGSELTRGEKHAAEEFPREPLRVTTDEIAAQANARVKASPPPPDSPEPQDDFLPAPEGGA